MLDRFPHFFLFSGCNKDLKTAKEIMFCDVLRPNSESFTQRSQYVDSLNGHCAVDVCVYLLMQLSLQTGQSMH